MKNKAPSYNKAKAESGVRETIRTIIYAVLIAFVVRTFAYEPFNIPSGSMIPTLEIGDYVIVEKWAYGARFPFTETAQATWSSPRRGDIVVLLAPPDNPRSDDLIMPERARRQRQSSEDGW